MKLFKNLENVVPSTRDGTDVEQKENGILCQKLWITKGG